MKSNTKPQVDHNRTQCGILHKVNNSNEKAKTEQFFCETVLEPNTKKLGNPPSFPTHTYITLSAKRFRNYRILMINVAAKF
jgi:hypothetical protein